MKNKSFIVGLFSLFSFSLFAKIDIKGVIKNYPNNGSEVKIIINDGTGEKKISVVKVDASGKFSYSDGLDYVGLVKLQLDGNKIIELVSDNTTINFEYDYKLNQFTSLKSDVNKAYQSGTIAYFKENILSELQSLQSLYKSPDNKDFSKHLNAEIDRLNGVKSEGNFSNYPFLDYYFKVQNQIKDFSQKKDKVEVKKYAEIFGGRLKNDSRFLETSGALKSVLVNYYSAELIGLSTKDSVEIKLDSIASRLLSNVVCESDRGQNILQASIDLFKASKLNTLSDKYLQKAQSLTCEIKNDKLKSVISAASIKVGNIMPDYTFQNQIKGKNSLYDIKAKEKIIVFYASWCGHCVREMPLIIETYQQFNSKGVEFLLISLDTDKAEYEKFSKNFPDWYNYAELSGWDSGIAKVYGIEGTPTIILLDENNKIKVISHRYEDVLKELH